MNTKLLILSALVLLAGAALPRASHAQDQTSGDDARPMTQHLCDKSHGPCTQMQQRHEQCQAHPRDCTGVTPDPAPLATAAPAQQAHRAPASAKATSHHPVHHHGHVVATTASASARERACQANPKGCIR